MKPAAFVGTPVLVLWLTFVIKSSAAFEPLAIGTAVGATVGSIMYAAWEKVPCSWRDCCTAEWIPNNLTRFEEQFEERVFGQHLAKNIIANAIKGHLVRKSRPSKALVLSFHGGTGGGKNFVANILAESLYRDGIKSPHVHLFVTTHDFQDPKKVIEYALEIQTLIQTRVSACHQNLFIFDEIDKMPPGLIDAVKPFIDHHESIGGLDYRSSIFIFLSNTGGRQIERTTLEAWENGRKRKELKLSDFENMINMGAFNEDGGLFHSQVIGSSLVDMFIPFLPLERHHVEKCVKKEAAQQGKTISDQKVQKVLNSLSYRPKETKKYVSDGCKRVRHRVMLVLEDDELF